MRNEELDNLAQRMWEALYKPLLAKDPSVVKRELRLYRRNEVSLMRKTKKLTYKERATVEDKIQKMVLNSDIPIMFKTIFLDDKHMPPELRELFPRRPNTIPSNPKSSYKDRVSLADQIIRLMPNGGNELVGITKEALAEKSIEELRKIKREVERAINSKESKKKPKFKRKKGCLWLEARNNAWHISV